MTNPATPAAEPVLVLLEQAISGIQFYLDVNPETRFLHGAIDSIRRARLAALAAPAPVAEPVCPDCNGIGKVFTHADDCNDDLCALNGDMHSCAGQVLECQCAAAPPAKGEGEAAEQCGGCMQGFMYRMKYCSHCGMEVAGEQELQHNRAVLAASKAPAAVPVAQALTPLKNYQLDEIARTAQIAFCLDKYSSFEIAFARGIEAAHNIGVEDEKRNA